MSMGSLGIGGLSHLAVNQGHLTVWICCTEPALVRGTQLTSTLTVASNYIIIFCFLPPLPSSSDCRMTEGDTNLPTIERKLGLQIWGIEVGQE